MVVIDIKQDTLAVLVAGIYMDAKNMNPVAIPSEIWLQIAEKIAFFVPWDYEVISFEDWIRQYVTILPRELISEPDLEYLQSKTLYWEYDNGGVLLSVSLDIAPINDDGADK